MSETGNDETYEARVAELLERLPALSVHPDSASRDDVWLLAGALMHTRAALAQLQQERDALWEALNEVRDWAETLAGRDWVKSERRSLYATCARKVRAALATSQKGACGRGRWGDE